MKKLLIVLAFLVFVIPNAYAESESELINYPIRGVFANTIAFADPVILILYEKDEKPKLITINPELGLIPIKFSDTENSIVFERTNPVRLGIKRERIKLKEVIIRR